MFFVKSNKHLFNMQHKQAVYMQNPNHSKTSYNSPFHFTQSAALYSSRSNQTSLEFLCFKRINWYINHMRIMLCRLNGINERIYRVGQKSVNAAGIYTQLPHMWEVLQVHFHVSLSSLCYDYLLRTFWKQRRDRQKSSQQIILFKIRGAVKILKFTNCSPTSDSRGGGSDYSQDL